ncbi:MAG: hypothetical protein UT94_C0022G0015, partial [Candidatus Uhrbacteria bacterium GW2011_GWF2_40_263]
SGAESKRAIQQIRSLGGKITSEHE